MQHHANIVFESRILAMVQGGTVVVVVTDAEAARKVNKRNHSRGRALEIFAGTSLACHYATGLKPQLLYFLHKVHLAPKW